MEVWEKDKKKKKEEEEKKRSENPFAPQFQFVESHAEDKDVPCPFTKELDNLI